MTADTMEQTVARLRHAYQQAVNGFVGDWKSFADGLLAPCIRELEAALVRPGGVPQPETELQRQVTEGLIAEGQKDTWVEMLSDTIRSIVVAAGAPDDWEGSVRDACDYIDKRFTETQAELDALRARPGGVETPPAGMTEVEPGLYTVHQSSSVYRGGVEPPAQEPLQKLSREELIVLVGCMQSVIDGLRSARSSPPPVEQFQDESAERTLKSIVTMLGWGNVPPRETLERDIAALKARAATPPPERPQELVNALEKAKQFIYYARYELQPGKAKIGDQFPKQEDADNVTAIIDAALAAVPPPVTEPQP